MMRTMTLIMINYDDDFSLVTCGLQPLQLQSCLKGKLQTHFKTRRRTRPPTEIPSKFSPQNFSPRFSPQNSSPRFSPRFSRPPSSPASCCGKTSYCCDYHLFLC